VIGEPEGGEIVLAATFNRDSAGQAKILAGDDQVRVTFENEYVYQPIVNVTAMNAHDYTYWVEDVDTTGFTIKIDAPQSYDSVFNWIAVAGKGAKLFVSDGTIEDVEIIVGTVEPDPGVVVDGEEDEVVDGDNNDVSADDSSDVSTDDGEDVSAGDSEDASVDEDSEVPANDESDILTDDSDNVSADDSGDEVLADNEEDVSADDSSDVSTDDGVLLSRKN